MSLADTFRALALIERLAHDAANALADEAEGSFTTAIEEIAAEADSLRTLVRTW